MRRYVSTWEELPNGVWLDDDEDIVSYVLSEFWEDKYQNVTEDVEKDLPSNC